MSRITIWNVIGWGFLLFLAVSKSFFSEQLSLITTGLGGLICLILALCMIFHEGKEKSQHSNELSE
ncbi:hypothetical protein OE059_10290 [Exiguobacterium profundum]|uniref:Uncharacterized protein n=1 Tax=Exiguobacterium profundum TaxID=307643 RepID=A0ABY8B1I5_9BACL|nr:MULTISPECIES: hypothetical protein [Exiguobacterium]MCM3281516.1 hypothetical protein [Exiguobacterium sp. MER 193]WED54439.1 hypothetical protein OE059_10290 [Exiguobacterium profundum]